MNSTLRENRARQRAEQGWRRGIEGKFAAAWADEQQTPGASRQTLGYLAAGLPGWRMVPGMALAFVGSIAGRHAWLGCDFRGRDVVAAMRPDAEQGPRRSSGQIAHASGTPADVLDEATGWLMLSLLRPFDVGFIRSAPRGAWEVRAIPVPPEVAGALPIGVAALVVAAARGRWGDAPVTR